MRCSTVEDALGSVLTVAIFLTCTGAVEEGQWTEYATNTTFDQASVKLGMNSDSDGEYVLWCAMHVATITAIIRIHV